MFKTTFEILPLRSSSHTLTHTHTHSHTMHKRSTYAFFLLFFFYSGIPTMWIYISTTIGDFYPWRITIISFSTYPVHRKGCVDKLCILELFILSSFDCSYETFLTFQLATIIFQYCVLDIVQNLIFLLKVLNTNSTVCTSYILDLKVTLANRFLRLQFTVVSL